MSRTLATCPLSTAPSQRSPFETAPQQPRWGQALGEGGLMASASCLTRRGQREETCAPVLPPQWQDEGTKAISSPCEHALGIHTPQARAHAFSLDISAHT